MKEHSLCESGQANPCVPGTRISSEESRSRVFLGLGGVGTLAGGFSGGGGGILDRLDVSFGARRWQ